MSFEHPNRNNESIRDVERDIMRRPPEHNTTNLDLDQTAELVKDYIRLKGFDK